MISSRPGLGLLMELDRRAAEARRGDLRVVLLPPSGLLLIIRRRRRRIIIILMIIIMIIIIIIVVTMIIIVVVIMPPVPDVPLHVLELPLVGHHLRHAQPLRRHAQLRRGLVHGAGSAGRAASRAGARRARAEGPRSQPAELRALRGACRAESSGSSPRRLRRGSSSRSVPRRTRPRVSGVEAPQNTC